MATKTIALTALTAMLAFSSAASAQKRSWLEAGPWQVWQGVLEDTGGRQACFAKYHLPTEQGEATLGFSQIDSSDNGTLHYSESGLRWTQLGTITMQIDNLAPWTAKTGTDKDQSQLTVGLGNNPAPFLMEVQYGSVLRIKTANGIRSFSLAGSNQAITTLLSCVRTIVAERNGDYRQASPSVPPLPAPTWTPLPRAVQPTGPARML